VTVIVVIKCFLALWRSGLNVVLQNRIDQPNNKLHFTKLQLYRSQTGPARPKAFPAAAIVRSRVCARTICIVCGWPCLLVCRFDRNEVPSDP